MCVCVCVRACVFVCVRACVWYPRQNQAKVRKYKFGVINIIQ